MCLRAGTQKNEEEAGDLHLKTRFHGQMSDTFHAAVFVTLSGGFQDAYTYICRGQVFANAQTGNIVLLSAALLRGDWAVCLKYVIPLLSFVFGTMAAEFIHMRFRNFRQLVLIQEIAFLLIVGFLPHSVDPLANALVSFRLRHAGAHVPQGPRPRLRQHDVHRQSPLRVRGAGRIPPFA